MKTFDVVTIITLAALAIATFICGFYNCVHFIFCGICCALVKLAWNEYKEQNEES